MTLTLDGEHLSIGTSYRYLGVLLCNEVDIFQHHEAAIRQSALRAQAILRRRCLWGCNRYVMVRDLWKLVHVPALTFGNAVVCLSAHTREWLECRQREVGRTAVGCHGAVAKEAIQGDLGWSSFEAREASSKLAYRGRLHFMSRERWARRVFDHLSATCLRTKWTKRLYNLEKKYGFFRTPIRAESETVWKQRATLQIKEEEEAEWRRSSADKSTLATYCEYKTVIGVERMYDNSPGSALLFEARAGALRTLVYRRRFDVDNQVQAALCRACGATEETMEHIVMRCLSVSPPPVEGATLPQALGFQPPQLPQPNSDGGGEDSATSADADAVVARTKCRLTHWWTMVRSRPRK